MGRIAEALKRAQQESMLKIETGSTATAIAEHIVSAPRTSIERNLSEPEVIHKPSMFNPPPPTPFPLENDLIPIDHVGSSIIACHQPNTKMVEKYRSIRTRLLTNNRSGKPRIYAVTSSSPHEGKTVSTANLGFVLAELKQRRIIMVDADFRKKGLSQLFKIEEQPGLAEVLRGDVKLAEVCHPVVKNNLYLIPAGQLNEDSPSELLAGPRAAHLYKEIKDRFNYGLIDTPPVNSAADIGLIGPMCHSVIIIIRMHRTPEHWLKRCVKMLQANHIPIEGCILAGYCDETMGYNDTHDYYDTDL